jgi:hypothetical protein
MAKAQQRAMEMDRCESKVITKKIHIILDMATLLKKGVKIPNLDRFMWIETK